MEHYYKHYGDVVAVFSRPKLNLTEEDLEEEKLEYIDYKQKEE